ELMEVALKASLSGREAKSIVDNENVNPVVNALRKEFEILGVSEPLFHAIKLAEGDELEVEAHPDLVNVVEEYKKNVKDEVFGDDLETIVADARYKYISQNCSVTYVHASKEKAEAKFNDKLSRSDKIDRILTNKWAGIPIFLVILFLIFHLTFSENLFWFGKLFEGVAPSFEGSMFEGLLWTDGGINSPGVIIFNFVGCLTDALSGLVAGWMASAPGWLSGLVVDGILAGVFSVLSFVPQILFLFLFFSILEDSGYMARVAFILDRIFRRFGLSGRAFMPMIMGFGCSVPAMINARTLATDNERTATIRVIPFFSCGAKQPILIAISAGICNVFDFPNKDLIMYSMYLIGIITAIVTVIIMRNTTMRGKVPPFIMELPAYHAPKLKSLGIHMWDKLKHYVKKAFTIILASTIIIWLLQSFTWSFKFIEQANPMDITEEVYESKLEDPLYVASLKALNDEYVDEEGNATVAFADVYSAYLEIQEDEEASDLEKNAYALFVSTTLSSANEEYKDVVNADDYIDSSKSILAGLGKGITWAFTPLGFGSQLNENGWIFPVSAVTGLIAKENVIATFAVLAQCTTTKATTLEQFVEIYEVNLTAEDGDAAATQMIVNTGAGWPALISFIVFNMTTIPCFAAVATAKAELVNGKDDKKGKKRFWMTIVFWLATSYITASMIYLFFEFWWPIAIFVVLAALGIYLIHDYNKKHPADAPEVLSE
ncbi:MAG: ferrous iron transporter B, partial [Gammaproteobacteria bacterium]|nr:ferrous iron transporter B [Gammaproteobacteria bacterium]